jgi:hypothetical protein
MTIAAREDAERISGRKRSNDMQTCTVETLHVQAKRAKYANLRNFKGNRNHQSNRESKFQQTRKHEENGDKREPVQCLADFINLNKERQFAYFAKANTTATGVTNLKH